MKGEWFWIGFNLVFLVVLVFCHSVIEDQVFLDKRTRVVFTILFCPLFSSFSFPHTAIPSDTSKRFVLVTPFVKWMWYYFGFVFLFVFEANRITNLLQTTNTMPQEEQSLLSISTIVWWESKSESDVWQKESKRTHACHWCIHSTVFKRWWEMAEKEKAKSDPCFFLFSLSQIIKWSQSRSNTDNGLFVMCQWHWQMPGTCFMIHTQQNESILCFVFVWFCPVLQKSTFRHLTETDHSFLIDTALKRGSCSGSQHSLRSFPLFWQHSASPEH